MTTKKKKTNAITEYERRWIKPTLIIATLVLIPVVYLIVTHTPVIHRAMTDYNASFAEAYDVAKRDDQETFYTSTPRPDTYPVIHTRDELPSEPLFISFYLLNCAYCEVAHDTIEGQRQIFIDDYPDYKDNMIYVDVKSPLGQELIEKYDVTGAASALILGNETATLLPMAYFNEQKGPQPDEKNMEKAYDTFTTLIQND